MEKLRVATVPGSKSITNRALLLAALSNREYLLEGAQFSDDSRYFLGALKALGFSVREDEGKKTVRIAGTNGRVPEKNAGIYVGSAGTAARFLTAMLALSDGTYTIQASEQMAGRPMRPLFDALASLGAEFTYLGEAGHLPVRVKGIFCGSVTGGEQGKGLPTVSLDISESTQYLSALLMTASMLPGGLAIQIISEKKRGSYIEITRRMMEEFGIRTEFDGDSYKVSAAVPEGESVPVEGSVTGRDSVSAKNPVPVKDYLRQENSVLKNVPVPEEENGYTPCGMAVYQIEPDVSAACYFYAAVMLTGGSVQVRHVHRDSMQGDMKFLKLLEQMGAAVEDLPDGIRVTASCAEGTFPVFPGLSVNMNDFSDQAITLAAMAPFATSPTVISGIAHIRRQESDRLHGIAENLTRMGIRVEESEDSVKIWPGQPKPCEIETYDDHRMAMGFALEGLRVPGMKIRNPECCRKTFKEYFDEMEKVFGLSFPGT